MRPRGVLESRAARSMHPQGRQPQHRLVDEFVDRGESAKPANRRELPRLLSYVSEARANYAIVHKVDRLAHNRADDVPIVIALRSCRPRTRLRDREHRRDPIGPLLYGTMSRSPSSTAARPPPRSQRATSRRPADGGTPCRAPLGYLDIRDIDHERARTITIDPEHTPLIASAYEAYATRSSTIRALVAQLRDGAG